MEVGSRNDRPARLVLVSLAVSFALLTLSSSALGQRQRERRAGPPQWHGDIGRFHEHDWGLWRGGHWAHSRHDGRVGWWWVLGSSWYFYPSPVYPYPNPWEPPPAVLLAPPLNAAPPAPPTAYWYYCEASHGYYPYVSTCAEGWKQVPATPNASSSAQTQ